MDSTAVRTLKALKIRVRDLSTFGNFGIVEDFSERGNSMPRRPLGRAAFPEENPSRPGVRRARGCPDDRLWSPGAQKDLPAEPTLAIAMQSGDRLCKETDRRLFFRQGHI